MKKIERKDYKFGTTATSEFYLNGELVGELKSDKRECGTCWFVELPSEEDAQMIEISVNEIPDNIYDELKEEGKI